MALLEAYARPVDPLVSAQAHALALSARYAGLSAEAVLDDAIHGEFAGGIALVSSFGAHSVALLHLVASVDRSTPVIFIDTGKIFGSTHRYRAEVVDRLRLTDVRIATPAPLALAKHDADSSLWLRDADRCCAIRKVAPLAQALFGFEAWISGRKRYQGGARTNLPVVEADGERIKVNPLAGWSSADVGAYLLRHDLPEHPLVADGFRSIGCMPCTTRVADGEDERDGRWRGRGKTECGIHLGLPALETEGSGI
jgi:phosphoadenosine phosphosulfate reductase